MEVTALSVGKSVLAGALDYAKSMVAKEIALQLGIESDVSFIGDELEMMQSFLMTANEENDKNKVLLTWVKQVREVAYNSEDNLMDFALHSEKAPFYWCIPRNLWERRSIAKEVKELRAKVEDVSNRNLRYRLIKGAVLETTTPGEQASTVSVPLFGINAAKRDAMEQEESKVDLNDMIRCGVEELSVFAVWGEHGDLGKTSAIMEIYDDEEVRKNFKCRAWVRLMHPFNPKDFLQSMVRQFYENFHDVTGQKQEGTTIGANVLMQMHNMELSDLVREFNAEVSGKSYLIVIDGLSTIMEWHCVKRYFPSNMKRNRIIISTQDAEIARLCVDKPQVVSELKMLPSGQTLYLFHRKVKQKFRTFDSTYYDIYKPFFSNNNIAKFNFNPFGISVAFS